MSRTVECYRLVYSCTRAPYLDGVICTRRRVYVGKNPFVGLSSFPHQFSRSRRYVEIFKPSCLFLRENNARVVALLIDFSPSQFLYVASPQASQTRKQKSPFDGRGFALRLRKPFHLVDGQVHTHSLFCLEILNALKWVDIMCSSNARLIQARSLLK